jgi:hypothetical protein
LRPLPGVDLGGRRIIKKKIERALDKALSNTVWRVPLQDDSEPCFRDYNIA